MHLEHCVLIQTMSFNRERERERERERASERASERAREGGRETKAAHVLHRETRFTWQLKAANSKLCSNLLSGNRCCKPELPIF